MINIPDIAGCGIFDSRAALHGQVRSVTRKVRYFELEFYPEDGKSSFIDGREYPIYAGNVIVAKPGQMKYCRILLVDDIFTTGSTVDAIASLLKVNGAEQVDFVCAAIVK